MASGKKVTNNGASRWERVIACAKGMIRRDRKNAENLRALVQLLVVRHDEDADDGAERSSRSGIGMVVRARRLRMRRRASV